MCELKCISLLHIFDVEWKHRRHQVENHIRLVLDKGIVHCNDKLVISHIGSRDAQAFFEQNAVAFRDIHSNCIAVKSGNETLFVADIEFNLA